MIRDRLVTHAVRQSYGERLPAGRYQAYLLYLEIDPAQVDVNVHPTKHEVRFRDARTVHDFLFSTLDRVMLDESGVVQESQTPIAQVAPDYRQNLRSATGAVAEQEAHYRHLYEVTGNDQKLTAPLGKAIAFMHHRFILAENQQGPLLVDALKARRQIALHYLQVQESGARGRPLLIPETLAVGKERVMTTERCAELIERLGFVINPLGDESVVVRQIPSVLEQCDIQSLVTTLLERLKRENAGDDSLLMALADEIDMDRDRAMTLSDMDEILRQLEVLDSVNSPFLQERVWRQLDPASLVQLIEK